MQVGACWGRAKPARGVTRRDGREPCLAQRLCLEAGEDRQMLGTHAHAMRLKSGCLRQRPPKSVHTPAGVFFLPNTHSIVLLPAPLQGATVCRLLVACSC